MSLGFITCDMDPVVHLLQYEECIKPFQDSLQVNSLQVDVWMRLAFAALETSKWEVAASAYRMCVTIEYDV